MTRKKFVKQLMAMGYQRNQAQRLADYARRGFWTYEQYLEIEKRYHAQCRAFENIKISCVDHMTPALKAAAQVVENMCKAIEAAMVQTPFGRAMLDWVKENVPQNNEQHPADALDAMVYGIDLANGPDMTAYAPNQHLDGLRADTVLVDEWDSLPSDKIHDQAMSACAGGGGHV